MGKPISTGMKTTLVFFTAIFIFSFISAFSHEQYIEFKLEKDLDCVFEKADKIYGFREVKTEVIQIEKSLEIILINSDSLKTKKEIKNQPEEISGIPLILIDGQEYNSMEEAGMQTSEIAKMNVIKNVDVTKIYGDKAKDGVVIIYSKTKYNSDIDDKSEISDKTKEEMPEFPCGEIAMKQYLAENIKYPAVAYENGIKGEVYVTFIITKTGKVTDAKITRSVDPLLDKEALRIVNSFPDWNPGKQSGIAVDVSYTVPVNFVLKN